MFRKLINTTDDPAVTILRLVLGVVFFAHGAQKVLGWFGGYGFSGTMAFFTQQAHIPAPLAFLAQAVDELGTEDVDLPVQHAPLVGDLVLLRREVVDQVLQLFVAEGTEIGKGVLHRAP